MKKVRILALLCILTLLFSCTAQAQGICTGSNPSGTQSSDFCPQSGTVCSQSDTICSQSANFYAQFNDFCEKFSSFCGESDAVCTQSDDLCGQLNDFCAQSDTICTQSGDSCTQSGTVRAWSDVSEANPGVFGIRFLTPGTQSRCTFAIPRGRTGKNSDSPEIPSTNAQNPFDNAQNPSSNTEIPSTNAQNPSDSVVNPLESPSDTTPSGNTSATVTAYEREVIRLVNEIRAQYGLSALSENAELCRVARYKSQDMHDKGYFDHTSPTYGTPFEMMKSFGISYRSAGENIAYGYATPQAVVDGWMNSSGHRANILNASYTRIGVGYVADGNYWTQMFIG